MNIAGQQNKFPVEWPRLTMGTRQFVGVHVTLFITRNTILSLLSSSDRHIDMFLLI